MMDEDDFPIVVPGEYVFEQDKLTIPAERVALVSSGVFAALGSAADEIATVAGLADRETQDARSRWKTALERLDSARSLLEALGWDLDEDEDEDVEDDEPRDIEVNLRAHHGVLLAALRTQREAERGHAESLPATEREQAHTRVAALSGLIEQAEAWEARA